MESNIQEKIIVNYPLPVTIKNTKKILDQMEKCICKIKNKKGRGTGFFCKISYENKTIPVLITNYHIIDENILKESKLINITLNDDEKDINIKIDGKRLIYTSEKYDTTIIEIKSNDNVS